jgi:hypothetical protein
MRPRSIIWFERIMLAALAVGLAGTILCWAPITASLKAGGETTPAVRILGNIALDYVLVAGLTLLASRRRSWIAIWFAAGIVVPSMPFDIGPIPGGLPGRPPVIVWLPIAAQLFALALAFTPGAQRWLWRGPKVSPEIFR